MEVSRKALDTEVELRGKLRAGVTNVEDVHLDEIWGHAVEEGTLGEGPSPEDFDI